MRAIMSKSREGEILKAAMILRYKMME